MCPQDKTIENFSRCRAAFEHRRIKAYAIVATMLRRKKTIVGIIALVVLLAGAFHFLTNRYVFLGQEFLLEAGQSVKVFATPLEISLARFENPCNDEDVDCITSGSNYPVYEYRMWGDLRTAEPSDDGDKVGEYMIDTVAGGHGWTRLRVEHR